MNIRIKQGHEHLSEKSLSKAEAKINKLSRLVTERDYVAQVFVSIERESGSQSSDKMWRASLNLDLAGEGFTAVHISSTPEKALDTAIRELKQEIKRFNAKNITAKRKSGGILKRLQREFA